MRSCNPFEPIDEIRSAATRIVKQLDAVTTRSDVVGVVELKGQCGSSSTKVREGLVYDPAPVGNQAKRENALLIRGKRADCESGIRRPIGILGDERKLDCLSFC